MRIKDRDLVSQLLDLSTELLIKGDAEAAMTCTMAAARIMAIPNVTEEIRNPGKGVSIDWNQLLRDMAHPSHQEDDRG